MDEKLIQSKDVCKILGGISRPTLSRIKNRIGFYRIGGQTMFSPTQVAAYLRRVETRRKDDHAELLETVNQN